MAKPIGNLKGNKSLPIFKTREFIRALEGIGFRQEKDSINHKHIKMVIERNGERIEHIAIKGNKDVSPTTIKKAINELAKKLEISKEEVIKKLLKNK